MVAGLVEVLQVRLQQVGHPALPPQRDQEVDLERIHLLGAEKCHVRLDKDSAAPAHRTWLGYSPVERKRRRELNMMESTPGVASRAISPVTSFFFLPLLTLRRSSADTVGWPCCLAPARAMSRPRPTPPPQDGWEEVALNVPCHHCTALQIFIVLLFRSFV